MARIAISCLQQRSRLSGTGRYIAELFHAFPHQLGEHEILLYAKADQRSLFQPQPPATRVRVLDSCPSDPLRRVAWEWRHFTRLLREDNVDLYHGPANFLPIRKVCPYVLTLHDMVYFHNPGRTFPLRAWYWQAWIKATWRLADAIITVSEFSRQQICRYLPIPPERIRVIHNGVSEKFFIPSSEAERRRVRDSFSVVRPYILYIGRLDPDKNVRRLIEAYAALLDQQPRSEADLVIGGIPEYKTSDLPALISKHGITERVRFLGFVPEEDLVPLYQECEAFCFPSLNEGFGLPVLEAMACGKAVVTSNISSLPEVAGDAGILVDPFSINAIRDGLAEALNPSRQSELGAAGRERAKTLTWYIAAEKTRAVYEEVLGGKR